jgi:predicted permease
MIAYLLSQQIVVLFLMMGLGVLLVLFGIVKSEDSRVLSLVTIYLISPCVIIKAFQINYTPAIRDGFLLALGAALAIHVVLFIVTGLLSRIFHFDAIEKASLIYSNSGNLIIPLVTAVLGEEWVIYASAFLCVQLFFVFTHCQSLMKGQTMLNFKRLFTNINIIAIFLGIIMFVGNMQLPKIPHDAVSAMAACIGPVSMVLLGMIMASIDWKAVMTFRRLYLVTLLKMLIVPLIVLVLLKYSGMTSLVANGKIIILISFLGVITPSATMVTQFAQIYRRDEKYASSINAVTTLVCIATMPLLIWLYMV